MKYGILMRNVIFLVDKRTTKTIKTVNITEVPPPPRRVQYFILMYVSSPVVSLGKTAVYEKETFLDICL